MYRWDGTELVAAPEPDTSPDVVDSWLEHDGYVGSWYLHEERFAASLPELDVQGFLAVVRGHIPHEGNWFPRVEAHGNELYLRVRPAPPLRTETVLWVPPTPDPRLVPHTKGPDLPVLGRLRGQAQENGADDAVLWSADGYIAEGANCALAWWESGGLMVPEHPRQLPSVTVAATGKMLGGLGRRPITLSELQGFPVWAGSALHGWTEVTGWVTAEGERLPGVVARTPMSPEMVNTLLRWN